MNENDFCGTGKNESGFCHSCYETVPAGVRGIVAIPSNQLQGKSTDELKAKFLEYQGQNQPLLDVFADTKNQYERVFAVYSQIFSKFDVLNKLIDSLNPNATKEYLGLEAASVENTIWDIHDLMSTVVGIGGTGVSVFRYWQKAKVAKSTQQAAAAAKGSNAAEALLGATDDAAKAAKISKLSKTLTVAGGVVSLGFGIWSLVRTLNSEAELRASLIDNLPKLDDWFNQTAAMVIDLCTATREMRKELDDLKSELGVSRDDELLAALDDALKSAGKFEAVLQIALRILCNDKDKPVAEQTPVATVAGITGLPENYIQSRKDLIAINPLICNAV
ncbi:hypothetical protein [Methylomonas methanica]|uniref:Uncharacterized protein n=1 Tax=Methylomonas methanica (strain DSM 25384 / MC09) TaxID=857087 RepID=G0A4L9_METMM|nr:hypothetical protein [Methylomonas methanica]AEG01610.1 hypothetical protein Metme_3237 [Methylomonas methanica MC09]